MDILSNDFEKYTGAVIYALIGSDGKRYIGQTINFVSRMRAHRHALNCISKGEYGSEGPKLKQAVQNGVTFRAEILEKIPLSLRTKAYLNERERYYYDLFGGDKGTYNSGGIQVSNYYGAQSKNIVVMFRANDQKMIAFLDSLDDYNAYIKELIRKDMT